MNEAIIDVEKLNRVIKKADEEIKKAQEKVDAYNKQIDELEAYRYDLEKMDIDEEKRDDTMGNVLKRIMELHDCAIKWHNVVIANIKIQIHCNKMIMTKPLADKVKAGQMSIYEFAMKVKLLDSL
jgi:seryl-tRNA synthetase